MAVPMVSPGSKTVQGFLFLLLGIGLLISAVIFGLKSYDFVREASRAEGKVVALNAGGSHPQIEFKTALGETVSYPQGGLIFGYEVGEPVRVLYKPENPLPTATIDSLGAIWNGELFLFSLGLFFAIAGGWKLASRNSI